MGPLGKAGEPLWPIAARIRETAGLFSGATGAVSGPSCLCILYACAFLCVATYFGMLSKNGKGMVFVLPSSSNEGRS